MSAFTALLFQGSIGVAGLILIWLFAIPVHTGGLSLIQSLAGGVLGALGTYGALLFLSHIPGLFPETMDQQMRGLHRFASGFGWLALAALSIVAGVGEELLFRGAVQGWLAGAVGDPAAIVVASLLFGLVHYISFTYFLVATGLGLLLGCAYAISGSIVLVMIWHAVYDMIALYCLVRFPHWFGVR
jgi:membrane protease YdiL (CAAX protease family)